MWLFLTSIAVLVAGAFAAFALGRSPGAARAAGVGSGVGGCVLGLVPAARVLYTGIPESLHAAWDVPWGSFAVEIDPLSAFFLLPIFGLSALAAIYGAESLGTASGRRSAAPVWGFTNLLVAGMAMAVAARNGVLFLAAWEVMSLAAFFLVVSEVGNEPASQEGDGRAEAAPRSSSAAQAGWTFLVAAHLGTAFLLLLFVGLGRGAESLDFDRFRAPSTAGGAGALFLLALAGFGAKAGFFPLHVWLPEAHPAAPSHVSAVMSGVMIKTGIYGLVRMLTFLGSPPAWWGWVLIAVGLSSGILGVLYALAQHDLKRLLAYHSVENIGIIALGLGVGMIGRSAGSPALAALGYAGALLHVVNHACFKGLLFLGAGAVAHATGTREIDRLGGLLRRMPWTAGTFLVGAAAICGLPPLNGFVSEFLIFLAAYRGAAIHGGGLAGPALAAIGGLALIGGLAAACFTKAFGIVFLGEPRTGDAAKARDPGPAMRIPMGLLAAVCLLMGVLAPASAGMVAPALPAVTGLSAAEARAELALAAPPLASVAACGAGFLGLAVLLAAARKRLLSGRAVGEGATWGCGYAATTPRMQYTASSFAHPLTDLFDPVLGTRVAAHAPTGCFPREASLHTETPDACQERVYRPLFAGVARALARLRWLQHGRVQLYVLYIAVTLLALLLACLG